MTVNKILRFALVSVIAAVCLLSSCGGGFTGDEGDAEKLGPGIFGPDSGR